MQILGLVLYWYVASNAKNNSGLKNTGYNKTFHLFTTPKSHWSPVDSTQTVRSSMERFDRVLFRNLVCNQTLSPQSSITVCWVDVSTVPIPLHIKWNPPLSISKLDFKWLPGLIGVNLFPVCCWHCNHAYSWGHRWCRATIMRLSE